MMTTLLQRMAVRIYNSITIYYFFMKTFFCVHIKLFDNNIINTCKVNTIYIMNDNIKKFDHIFSSFS